MEDEIWSAILAHIPEVTREGRKIQSAGESGPDEYEEWKLNPEFVEDNLYNQVVRHIEAIVAEVKKVERYGEIYRDSDEWTRNN